MLSCGTGAWRVRTSMNRLSKSLGVTCTVDVGLMSIEFNCFDGKDCVSQSLSIANTGVNTSKLYRMEQFVDSFPKEEVHLTGGKKFTSVLMKLNEFMQSTLQLSSDWQQLLHAVHSLFFLAVDLWK